MLTRRLAIALLAAAAVCTIPVRSFAGGPVAFSPVRPGVLRQSSPEQPPQVSRPVPKPARSVSPGAALLHSLLLPGWGQFDNGHPWKAAFLVAAEAVCIGGIIYESRQLSDDTLTPLDQDVIRTNRNTYILYLMLAKVVGMMDAYVDAQLAHFDVTDLTPPELETGGETP